MCAIYNNNNNIGVFAFSLEPIFLTRNFFVIIIFFFFFIFFFLSHRPSALSKRGKELIFTPNISTGDGGVHRHQAIAPFLLYDTRTNYGAFKFTSLNNAILQPPRLSAYALYMAVYIARVVASLYGGPVVHPSVFSSLLFSLSALLFSFLSSIRSSLFSPLFSFLSPLFSFLSSLLFSLSALLFSLLCPLFSRLPS